MRAANESIGHFADVNQSAIFQTNVDEHTKVDNVEDSSLQFHLRLEILDPQDSGFENGLRQVFTGIATGTNEVIQNVPNGRFPGLDLLSNFGGDAIVRLSPKFFEFAFGTAEVAGVADALQNLLGRRVTFRVNPCTIQGLVTPRDLEETCRLRKRLPDSVDILNLFA